MLKKILLLCFLCTQAQAFALTPALRPENLMHIKNLPELHKMVKNLKTEKQLKTNCLLQLKNKKVPIFCYQWLKNKKSNKIQFVISYLDEKCIESLKFLKNLKIITQMMAEKSLTSICKNQLKKKKQILEYQLRDHHPEKVLKWYLNF